MRRIFVFRSCLLTLAAVDVHNVRRYVTAAVKRMGVMDLRTHEEFVSFSGRWRLLISWYNWHELLPFVFAKVIFGRTPTGWEVTCEADYRAHGWPTVTVAGLLGVMGVLMDFPLGALVKVGGIVVILAVPVLAMYVNFRLFVRSLRETIRLQMQTLGASEGGVAD
jgi:hypothetical protein